MLGKLLKRNAKAPAAVTDPTTAFFAEVMSGDIFTVTGPTGRKTAYKSVGFPTRDGLRVQWLSGPSVFQVPFIRRDAAYLAPEIVYRNPYMRGLKYGE